MKKGSEHSRYDTLAPCCRSSLIIRSAIGSVVMLMPVITLAQIIAPLDSPPAPPPNSGALVGAVSSRCPPADDVGEITICGSRDRGEQYRLKPLPEKYVAQRIEARIDLPGGKTISANASAGRLGDTQAVLTLKVPF